MVEEGPAKGHGVMLDHEFVENVVAYDQANFSSIGLKARFGHPSASSETMGTQLGVFSNFRKRRRNGKMQAIADLKLLKAANESPTHPGMSNWVLDMAEERPDFIMSSIVFRGSGYYQKKENGHKRKVENEMDYDETQDLYVEFDAENGAEHFYTDLVEQGAATDNLFSTKVNTHLFAAQVDDFLSNHPHLIDYLKDNPDDVAAWLDRAGYSITQEKKKSMFNFLDWLSGKEDNTPTKADWEEMRTALLGAKNEIAVLKKERDEFKGLYEDALQRASDLQLQADALKKQVEQLQADLTAMNTRLSVVEKSPSAAPTGGNTPPAEPQPQGMGMVQLSKGQKMPGLK